MATGYASDVMPKSCTNFYLLYQWVSPADGQPTLIYIDEIASDGTTVVASKPYWLSGAVNPGPAMRVPVNPLSFGWQSGAPNFQMRCAPYPDVANPADTYHGTLMNSSARVALFDTADAPASPAGSPLQQVICSSSAGSGGDLNVLVRNLWLPEMSFLSGVIPSPADFGYNMVEPDLWTTLAFTGSADESLDTGWASPVVFVAANDTTQALVDESARILSGVDPIAGREDGLAYVGLGLGEIQLTRHMFTMPTLDGSFSASLTLYSKGWIIAVTINGQDLPDTVALTTSTVDGTCFVQGDIPAAFFVQGEDNILAFASINFGVTTADPSVDDALGRAQFAAYSLMINT